MRGLGMVVALGASAFSLGSLPEAQGKVGVCDFYREVYQSEIKPKIQSGIPFELMGVLTEDGSLIARRVIHINFNLWDERVTMKSEDRVLAKVELKESGSMLCRHLEMSEPLKRDKKYVYRLLLNPMWGERMARLQVFSGADLAQGRIIGINWRKLADEMPSDKILLEKEVKETLE